MLSAALIESLRTLHNAITDDPGAREALLEHWRGGASATAVQVHAELVARSIPALSRTTQGAVDLGNFFAQPEPDALMLWCEAMVARREVRLAPLLASAVELPDLRDEARRIARARVVEGPLLDALACAPHLGTGDVLALPDHAEARARMEILVWEAGACALQLPDLGAWVFGSEKTFEALVGAPARGTLRGRVLAACALEICAPALSHSTPEEIVHRTLQVLQPLLLHPEPLVWVHAARAFGRLAGQLEVLSGTLLDWLGNASPLLRQRSVTAFASMPAESLKMLAGELVEILDAPTPEPWVLAAASAATPFLFSERRDLWDKLAARVLSGDGGAIGQRALARGLGALWRRGVRQAAVDGVWRQLRERARSRQTASLDDARRWLEVIATTDPLDGAERDPLDLETGLENLVRIAAQYDDEEADGRAARCAASLRATFQEAMRGALGATSVRRRAAALNALEGAARSLALGLWGPLLLTSQGRSAIPEPDLQETWREVADAPEALLVGVSERRRAGTSDAEADLALEVLALKLGGYALDACGEDPDIGPGRGSTAHHTCLWLRKLEGLADGSRELPVALRNGLSSIFWRLVDTTRGTSLGDVDDVRWLGPFAAWWALVIDRPAMLEQLGSALPMMSPAALKLCCEKADALRAALTTDPTQAADGRWRADAAQAMADLHAGDTELSVALLGLADALTRFVGVAGHKPGLEAACLGLASAAERLHAALADPVKALHSAPARFEESEETARVAGLVARAIRTNELATAGVWFGSLGPVTSAMVEAAVNAAARRTPPPPPAPRKPVLQTFEGYELIKPLGEGGVGSVWLVRKPGADRMFVLKIPKADTLEGASDTEREGILASFVEEARALAGLYHPNVANIIDRGVSEGRPFLVLEYLIGADLKAYAAARPMSLYELRQVLNDVGAGLAALHAAGLVHRDVKPANLWLRLPLAGGERFDPAKHRDPAVTPPLSSVVIDFGMVRASKLTADTVGRFVAGTPGYIAPEQVLDPVELDPRADVYALAGSVYNVLTGRTFFDEIASVRDRILAHMQRDPFEDPARLRGCPERLARLFRAATAKDPQARPGPIEFAREFSAML